MNILRKQREERKLEREWSRRARDMDRQKQRERDSESEIVREGKNERY